MYIYYKIVEHYSIRGVNIDAGCGAEERTCPETGPFSIHALEKAKPSLSWFLIKTVAIYNSYIS